MKQKRKFGTIAALALGLCLVAAPARAADEKFSESGQ